MRVARRLTIIRLTSLSDRANTRLGQEASTDVVEARCLSRLEIALFISAAAFILGSARLVKAGALMEALCFYASPESSAGCGFGILVFCAIVTLIVTSAQQLNGMFPSFRCTRMLMAGGADTPSNWR